MINVEGVADADVTANLTVAAAGCVVDNKVKDVQFTVTCKDSNNVITTITVPKSSVSWKAYVGSDTEGEPVVSDSALFRTGTAYMATFTVDAPLGVTLKNITADWNAAHVSLNGNTVEYWFAF